MLGACLLSFFFSSSLCILKRDLSSTSLRVMVCYLFVELFYFFFKYCACLLPDGALSEALWCKPIMSKVNKIILELMPRKARCVKFQLQFKNIRNG
jgi:hypothetical protein